MFNINNKLSLENVDLTGKRVLMRVDFNVQLDDGQVKDDLRIVAALPSIKYVLGKGSSVVLMSHLGRPDGRPRPEFSLKPVAEELSQLLGQEVIFAPDCVGPEVEDICLEAPAGSVILLENLRFHPEEEGKGKDASGKKVTPSPEDVKKFCASLTRLGNVFVNDAFGTAHRAHSSVVGVDLPIRAAGFLMKKELAYFGKALDNPKRPFLAILGGSKVRDKFEVISSLLDKVDEMIITGAFAYTFQKVLRGMQIGASMFDKEGSEMIWKLVDKAKKRNVQMTYSVDFKTASRFSGDAECGTATVASGVPSSWMALDIGPESMTLFHTVIQRAATIIWNGPVGMYKFENFFSGSQSVLESVCLATEQGSTSIIAGGGTGTVTGWCKRRDKVSHISTGGGASLAVLEGKRLPGVTSLTDACEL